jgi:hypothetical protein
MYVHIYLPIEYNDSSLNNNDGLSRYPSNAFETFTDPIFQNPVCSGTYQVPRLIRCVPYLHMNESVKMVQFYWQPPMKNYPFTNHFSQKRML